MSGAIVGEFLVELNLRGAGILARFLFAEIVATVSVSVCPKDALPQGLGSFTEAGYGEIKEKRRIDLSNSQNRNSEAGRRLITTALSNHKVGGYHMA